MTLEPRDFDGFFRRAVAAQHSEPEPAHLKFSARCGQHTDQEMRPRPGQSPPLDPLPADYSVRVACPDCGLEVVLGFQATTEESS